MINIKGDYQIGYEELVQVVRANSENPICNFYERGFIKQKQVDKITKDILSDYNDDINLIQQQIKLYKDAQDKLFGEEP